MQEVNIAKLKACTFMAYKIMRPVLALGSPGIGKSAGLLQAARELEISFLDIRATLLDPVDLRGIPTIQQHVVDPDHPSVAQTVWAQPIFLPTSGKGILLIDELPTAPPMVQAALLQLILDRRLGEYTLPDGWLCVAAGNKVSDKAGASKLNTALASRFIRLNVICDPLEWRNWANDNGITTEVISFLNWKPSLLHDFDPRKDSAFPSPRTWDFTSDVTKHLTNDPVVDLAMLEGCVGEAAAAEFKGFLDIYLKLKAPEVYLANPDDEDLPTVAEPALLYALCGSLAERASEMEDGRPLYATAIVKIANRLPAEYSVLLIDTAIRKNPEFADTSDYISWSMKHTDVL